jgi:hypothetical protein
MDDYESLIDFTTGLLTTAESCTAMVSVKESLPHYKEGAHVSIYLREK